MYLRVVAPVALALAACLVTLWRPPGSHSVEVPLLPAVDVGALAGPGRAAAVAALAAAARRTGVARLVNHSANVAGARAAAKAYFALPDRLKDCEACSRRNISSGYQRGYIPFAAESGLASILEVKEGFCYGFEWPEDRPATHPYQTPNVWPDEEALDLLGVGWRSAMRSFFDETISVSQAVAHAAAEALGAAGDALPALVGGGETISQMRLFHYWPAPPESAKQAMGSSPHTDWHTLTVISRDDASSLQYIDQESGEWREAAVGEGELVLLIGDWLSMFSRGVFRSAPHRVLSPENESSLSFVLFFYPAADARLPRDSAGAAEFTEKVNTVDDSMLELPWGEFVVNMWARVMSNR